MKKLLLLTFLFMASAYGEIISIQATGIYEMAPSDTKAEAASVAVGLAKINAIEKVGTAVQSSFTYTQSSDDTLVSKQDARVYSAALMRSRVVSTHFSKNTCTVIIEAKVDNSRIDEYLNATPETKTALSRLEEKHKEIEGQIERLNLKIKNLSDLGFAKKTNNALFEAVKLRKIELKQIDIINEDIKRIVSISSKELLSQVRIQRLNRINGKLAADAFFSHVRKRVVIKPTKVKIGLSSKSPDHSQLQVDFRWRMPWGEKHEADLNGLAHTEHHTTYQNEYLRLLSEDNFLKEYIEKHDIYIAVTAFGLIKKYPISYVESSTYRSGYTVKKGTMKDQSVFFTGLTDIQIEAGTNIEYEIIIEERSAVI
ncbi:MAG: hypothetical protein U9Q62_08530 [Campylobacterota bacterium]|nr:hypothetical protein [Campylobacterota bacterium]